MLCGFFCDTGVIRGLCDSKDDHYDACQFFFNKYPLNSNDYYIAKPVEEELNYYKLQLNKRVIQNKKLDKKQFKYVRSVENCIDLYIRNMKIFNCSDHGASHETKLKDLILDLMSIIGHHSYNLKMDTNIVANSVIWSLLIAKSENTLITVDYMNIIRNRDEIINAANFCLGTEICLSMLYLPEYCEHHLFYNFFNSND